MNCAVLRDEIGTHPHARQDAQFRKRFLGIHFRRRQQILGRAAIEMLRREFEFRHNRGFHGVVICGKWFSQKCESLLLHMDGFLIVAL